MMDVHSKKVRSYNMSRIKGENTKPEVLVRKFLFSKGYRFRLHDKKLPGKPDIVMPKYKSVILINGCFWHGHDDCKYFVIPKTRSEWWLDKIHGNKQRDLNNIEKLNAAGWKILTIFECELKPALREKTFNRIIKFLT
jgi:DNA mismatch endonuclease (patch repair protein)